LCTTGEQVKSPARRGGQGALVFVHGAGGSHLHWPPQLRRLAGANTYALDLPGHGQSEGQGRTSISAYADFVAAFLGTLGLEKVTLVGHSMGGTVSLSVAINHPRRVSKVVVIGSPIEGSSLSVLLKLASIRTIAKLVYRMMKALKFGISLAAPIITRESQWPAMIHHDLNQVTLESFLMSISSLRQTDLTPQLAPIYQPVMGMYGDRDVIVNPNQWNLLDANIQRVRIERFRRAGHFIMLDEPHQFKSILKEYLDSY